MMKAFYPSQPTRVICVVLPEMRTAARGSGALLGAG
jgi:hypothetical protein